jgi:phosphoribosylaminoimidazolecarboxamide formyltransferase/IMP cyclohydrolase
MTEENEQGLRRIRRALLSVSDKAGLVEFAQKLRGFGVELLSTGGTAAALREAGIEVRDVSDVTGFPEMLDGRVKTLHPRIHGGLLAIRDDEAHMSALREHGIEPIDLVVINLYPFEQTIARVGVTLEEAIEQIDIGGPAMIRSASKNYKDVAVVVVPATYGQLLDEMRAHDGALTLATRARLARQAFIRTALYDSNIFAFLGAQLPGVTSDAQGLGADPAALAEAMKAFHSITVELINQLPPDAGRDERAGGSADEFPADSLLSLNKVDNLRYGENPHQSAALYEIEDTGTGIAHAEILSGKEMSYNNYVDADAAWQLVCDFDELACAIIKHTNPAGVALGASAQEAYRRALATDPTSAFGGIVAFNREVDEAAARAIVEIFTEVVVAPDFNAAALEILRTKKNLRVLRAGVAEAAQGLEYKQIGGGMLVQTRDTHRLTLADLKVVTKRAPSDEEMRALLFAWTVCKHTKSNAIVYARGGHTVGVGAGQMSRVDSVKLGASRAQLPVKGSVLASDAFFPFRDGLDEAARHGITAVIQPGGSVRDAEVIAAADEHDLAMVFTGVRHFKH